MDGELIYNIINDFYSDDTLPVSEDMNLKETFGEGSECSRLSEKMYQAKLNLCQKLGEEENAELEIIFDCMERIMKTVSLKMFECGTKQASETEQ